MHLARKGGGEGERGQSDIRRPDAEDPAEGGRMATEAYATEPDAPHRQRDAADGIQAVARWRSEPRRRTQARPCQPRGPPPPQRNAAMRNAPDREATAPERNLAIAERCGRNAERRISRASTVGAVDRAR